jgi:sec-independent protein translocase protein TatB
MFEVGFSELLLIMVLALLVLGPQKLPKVVGQVGRWMGRARAMARQFREQLEIEAAEAQRPPPPAAPPQAAAPPQDAAPPISPPTPPPPSAVDDYVRRSDADERREP